MSARREGLKVFGIGLQKTGTSSLHRIMQDCGFKAMARDREMVRCYADGNYSAILRYYDTADFFRDWPTPLMYKLAYKKYGRKARFILTVRQDAQTWFESLKRHNRYAHPLKNKHHWVFGRYYPHRFDEEHIAYYNQHNAEVVRFFEQAGASDLLLIVRIEEPDLVVRISEFLGIEIPGKKAPHVNKGDRNIPGVGNYFKKQYNRIVQPAYGWFAPRLFGRAPRQLVAVDPDAIADVDLQHAG